MRGSGALVLVVVCLSVAGCGGISSPSTNTVDTFKDTLQVGGSKIHAFSASKTGEILVKVTELTPSSQNALVGLTWAQAGSDGGCTTTIGGVIQQTFAQLNVQAIGGQILKGSYCLIVQDVGTFTVPEAYTITVSHP